MAKAYRSYQWSGENENEIMKAKWRNNGIIKAKIVTKWKSSDIKKISKHESGEINGEMKSAYEKS
jgi:hypothetical protein